MGAASGDDDGDCFPEASFHDDLAPASEDDSPHRSRRLGRGIGSRRRAMVRKEARRLPGARACIFWDIVASVLRLVNAEQTPTSTFPKRPER